MSRPKILVVDIGGSHVKLMTSPRAELKFDSGSQMAPRDFVARFGETVRELPFDKVSIGFPAPVRNGRIIKEPTHLPSGWAGFNFARALGKPARVINDAAMQALGSHARGRTLFLGLGTGLGAALVWQTNVLPLELGHLPYRERKRLEEFLGKSALEKAGKQRWQDEVHFAIAQLKIAFIADTVVVGGGNVHNLDRLPAGAVKGDNRNAYVGGRRLWETDRATGKPRWNIM